jgi:hypothetical protein
MIQQMRIANFKPFGPHGKQVQLRPLNVLIGANSVGKSSFVQSLLLLKQSWRPHEELPIQLRTSGGLVELGNLKNIIHKHEPGTISIGASIGEQRIDLLYNARHIGLAGKSGSQSARLEEIRFPDRILPSALEQAFGCRRVTVVAKVEESESTEFHGSEAPIPMDLYLHPDESLPSSSHKRTKYAVARVVLHRGEWEYTPTLETDESLRDTGPTDGVEDDGTADSTAELHDAVTVGLHQFLEQCYSNDLSRLREHIQSVRYIGPLRARGTRFYDATQKQRDFVDTSGRNFAHLVHSRGLQPKVNTALRALTDSIGRPPYTMEIREVGNSGTMLEVVFGQEIKTGNDQHAICVGLPDLGCGLSQILPFLVQLADAINQAMTSNAQNGIQQCIIIEQPELHLHPAMQKELANLIVSECNTVLLRATGKPELERHSAPDEYEMADEHNRRRYRHSLPQLIIETHSPYLAEQFRDCVQEASLHKDFLRFLSFTQERMEVQIKEIDVDEDGDFTALWPDGYFDI